MHTHAHACTRACTRMHTLVLLSDHTLKLDDGEDVIIGKALLRTAREQMYTEYLADCKADEVAPLDHTNFANICTAAATGKTERMGCLDTKAEMGRLNIERCQKYLGEISQAWPQFNSRATALQKMFTRGEGLLRPATLSRKTTDSGANCTAEQDRRHAFADPDGKDASRPAPRAITHDTRCPELALIPQLSLELDDLLRDVDAALASSESPNSPAAAKRIVSWKQCFDYSMLRVKHAYAHAMQAAHEVTHSVCSIHPPSLCNMIPPPDPEHVASKRYAQAPVLKALISSLQHGEAGLIADWKAKWLAAVFREPQSKYFGKKGIPLHGCMAYVPDGEGNVSTMYYDAVMGALLHSL